MFERKGEFNFVLIGAKSTGKTWYIKHLAKREGISALNDETIKYIDIISQKDEGTSISYTELYFTYKDDIYNIDFQIDDYDGNFVETWHQNEVNSEYKEKLTEYVKESEGIFIFLPYENAEDAVRFDMMQKETDVFINKIKEEYGEEHSELPIPVIIVVSKWDRSVHFGDTNEYEKAREYIENNSTLNLIKKKIQTHFKHIDIVPLSSAKDYNVEVPIRMCLDYTFAAWEKKIEALKEKKEELLIFLHAILYDIRFYKEGEYKELYNSLEKEFAAKIIEELKRCDSVEAFDDYVEHKVYKTSGSDSVSILNALASAHQEEIDKIRKKLLAKKRRKQFLTAAVVVGVIGVGVYIYSKYQDVQQENKLYKNIQVEAGNKNFVMALEHIALYYNTYPKANKEHYDELKKLEEKIKASYRDNINKELAKVDDYASLLKRYDKTKEIYNNAQKYGFSKSELALIKEKYYKYLELKEKYDEIVKLIQTLSLDDTTKKAVEKILSLTNTLSAYSEAVEIRKDIKNKISSLISAVDAGSIQDIDTVNNLIYVVTKLNKSETDLEKLKVMLAHIKLKEKYDLYKESISNEESNNLSDILDKATSGWDEAYGTKAQEEMAQIIASKYNDWLDMELKGLHDDIRNIDDYNRIEKFIVENETFIARIKELPFNITQIISKQNVDMFDKIQKLYGKYKDVIDNGIYTSSMVLAAETQNSLDITETDNEVVIYINNYRTYDYKNAGGSGRLIKLFNTRKYYVASYTFTIIEVDFGMEKTGEKYTNSFSIDKNGIIKLANEGSLTVYDEDGLKLTIKK